MGNLVLKRTQTHRPFASIRKISVRWADFLEGAWKWWYHVLTNVVDFVFGTFVADLTLLCARKRVFVWRRFLEKGWRRAENARTEPTWLEHYKFNKSFVLKMNALILTWTNRDVADWNHTKICPGQKFVTNEYQMGALLETPYSHSRFIRFGSWINSNQDYQIMQRAN